MTVCDICQESISEKELTIQTKCTHTFHQACMTVWIQQQKTVCPTCKVPLKQKEPTKPSQMSLRSNTQQQQPQQPSTSTKPQPQNAEQQQPQQQQQQQQQQQTVVLDDNRIRNLVASIISDRQVNLLGDLENNLVIRMEQQIESSMTNLLQHLTLNYAPIQQPEVQTNNIPAINNISRPNSPNLDTQFNRNQSNRPLTSIHFSDATSGNNSSHYARLIKSWEIKFDGSTRLSVESFIYRLESQVVDNLNGNFNILCENIQSLLTDAAKDWYWSYRRSVNRVTWPSFCEALRHNFEEHKTDTEIKETIRNRKQGPVETFDEYRNAIYKLTEKLFTPIPEKELVEILQRGLRPRIRQQLLYLPISNVAELRKLCLKGEHLYNEINKTTPIIVKKPFIRQKVEEIELNLEIKDPIVEESVEIDEVKVANINCWNCRKQGHRYHDCLEARTIFCYGCGEINTYKPSCARCNPGNVQRSETRQIKPRYDQKQ